MSFGKEEKKRSLIFICQIKSFDQNYNKTIESKLIKRDFVLLYFAHGSIWIFTQILIDIKEDLNEIEFNDD